MASELALLESLRAARGLSSPGEAIRNSTVQKLLVRINQKKTLDSYQKFSVYLIQAMCAFSLHAAEFETWHQERQVTELLAREHEIKIAEEARLR